MALEIDALDISSIMIEECDRHIMPLYNRLGPEQIRSKGVGGDVVTDADEAMEFHMGERLREYLPDSVVFGEESYGRSPETADVMAGDDYIWVIDPLDGTRNFMQGKSHFCSMLALIRGGEALASWIYLPIERRMLVADIENGAYEFRAGLSGERRMIRIAGDCSDTVIGERVGQINFGIVDEGRRADKVSEGSLRYKSLDRLFCAGYDFAGMCLEERHFSVYRHLWWWDHIPGVFILQQAGGTVFLLSGDSYSVRIPARGLVSAVSGIVAADVVDFLGIV